MVAGKVEIARIEHRCGAGQALQNRRLEIVDHDFGGHATQGREAVFVAGEKMLHGLGDCSATIRIGPARQSGWRGATQLSSNGCITLSIVRPASLACKS